MRTKTIAVLEVLVVWCSLFLVALPVIAADQTTQKAITTASEDEFTLGIYGNANEDDTIDMRDTTYIKLVIFGKKPKTDLADANYDGKVSMLDVGQTKLIILGKEKELTISDCGGGPVTVHKPLNRIIVVYHTTGGAIRALGSKDRVVGVCDMFPKVPTFFPDLSKKQCVGNRQDLDVEKILELEPDAVILHQKGAWASPNLEDKLKGTGIDVIRVSISKPETLRNGLIQFGYLLDEVENARNYFEWHDKYIDEIKERVSGIPEDKRTRVFIEDGGSISERKISPHIKTCEQAGGIQLGADLYVAGQKTVEVEWIIEQNPEVIVAEGRGGGYETEDVSHFKAHYDEILGVPGFDQIKAVQDNRVYITTIRFGMALKSPIGTVYMAKWFYPDLFEDLDPQAMHQEYVDKFCPGLDFDVSEHGVFVYPPIE